jgi:hypothetical protein
MDWPYIAVALSRTSLDYRICLLDTRRKVLGARRRLLGTGK